MWLSKKKRFFFCSWCVRSYLTSFIVRRCLFFLSFHHHHHNRQLQRCSYCRCCCCCRCLCPHRLVVYIHSCCRLLCAFSVYLCRAIVTSVRDGTLNITVHGKIICLIIRQKVKKKQQPQQQQFFLKTNRIHFILVL